MRRHRSRCPFLLTISVRPGRTVASPSSRSPRRSGRIIHIGFFGADLPDTFVVSALTQLGGARVRRDVVVVAVSLARAVAVSVEVIVGDLRRTGQDDVHLGRGLVVTPNANPRLLLPGLDGREPKGDLSGLPWREGWRARRLNLPQRPVTVDNRNAQQREVGLANVGGEHTLEGRRTNLDVAEHDVGRRERDGTDTDLRFGTGREENDERWHSGEAHDQLPIETRVPDARDPRSTSPWPSAEEVFVERDFSGHAVW